MPYITVNGARLHYEEHGSGRECVLFAHGLLWSGRMFDAQVQALQDRYRCVTVDFRGQGQSEVTRDGYDMDTLTADFAALIEALKLAPCHFVGLSMGGFVGLRLAIRRPELLRSLALLDTSAEAEVPANVRRYRLLNLVAQWLGIGVVAGSVMKTMFAPKFLTDPHRQEERALWRRRLLQNNRWGATRAVKGVVERTGVADQLAKIQTPTLILVGEHDAATTPGVAQRLHAGIARSRLTVIPDAGHTSTVEEPAAVDAALEAFLACQPAAAD